MNCREKEGGPGEGGIKHQNMYGLRTGKTILKPALMETDNQPTPSLHTKNL